MTTIKGELLEGETETGMAAAAQGGQYGAAAERASEAKRALRLAVASSMVSKVCSIGLQAVSIPLFARVLDTDDFSAMMVYFGVTAWLSLVAIGIWPTVTSIAADDRRRGQLAGVLTVSWVGLSAIFASLILLVLILRPVLETSGINLFSARHYSLFTAALVCYAMLTVLSVGEAVNQGQHRQHVNNLITAAGSILNVVFILLVTYFRPPGEEHVDVTLLFVASQAGFILIRVVNMIGVVVRAGWPHAFPGKAFARELARNSWSLLQAQLAVVFLQQGAVLLCYETDMPRDAALLALLFRANLLLHSFVYMINQPLWPIIHRNMLAGDWQWVIRIYRKLATCYVAYGLLAIIGAAFVGGAAVSLWTAGEYPISNKLATLCAVYFALLVTSAASTPVLMGAKAFVSLGNIGMAEFLAAGVLCTILYFADAVSFPHVVEALIAANAMTALWMMPTQAIVRLSRGSLDAQH
ncbi:oligosaccharide flippase family protein [Cupriavidus metallidurans]|uniref:lipopolysaccharide biosynthesis protein n=1 Tax=Cupriavidus TaxID=106589 RepID=UPI0002A34338|nr:MULTISPECIES: oligosaccharide flippase family protein [Cupriavidus]EKZ97842.1 hypothetical protein D769_18219 [Cupriavidus sp. HMR-1]GMG92676.1 hypothetical protein Cmtc_38960 [Cupriavidus sp. TKC]HBD36388.1 hypothetical protein [Cupriavidus sp.]